MSVRRAEYERIAAVLREVDPEDPLTAREIRDLLEEHGVEVESAHRVATVLGRWADDADDLDVIHDHPYRYRINT